MVSYKLVNCRRTDLAGVVRKHVSEAAVLSRTDPVAHLARKYDELDGG
jgi:hypothetical protein